MITKMLNTSPPITAPMPMLEGLKMEMVFKASSGPLHPRAISVAPATSSGIWKRSLMTSMVRMKCWSQTCAMPQKR